MAQVGIRFSVPSLGFGSWTLGQYGIVAAYGEVEHGMPFEGLKRDFSRSPAHSSCSLEHCGLAFSRPGRPHCGGYFAGFPNTLLLHDVALLVLLTGFKILIPVV